MSDAEGAVAEVVRELARRRADLAGHGRSSLESHLLGVHGILERWGQPERVSLAGLLHSAYSTQSYRYSLFALSERSRVRELVGASAERLVFAFCGCERRALFRACRSTRARSTVRVGTRWPGTSVDLDGRALAELLVIHSANLFEQSCRSGGSPAACLATLSRWLRRAVRALDVAPPVLGAGTRRVSREEERDLLRIHRELLRHGPGALDLARSLSTTQPVVGEPLVLGGIVALAHGDGELAALCGGRAEECLGAWGHPWDKRLALPRWVELAMLLQRDGMMRDRELEVASRRIRLALDASRGSPARLWAGLDASGAMPRRMPPPPPPIPRDAPAEARVLPVRFARYIAGLRSNEERPMMQVYPGLRAQPWHDPREFSIVAELERRAADIAEEARRLEASAFQEEAEDIRRKGRWSVLFLLEAGRRHDDNLARCSTLRSILDSHRILTTRAGLVYFSCLDPGTRVSPHRGPTNMRLRCHLGLEVPEKGCGIRVGGVSRRWEEGRCLVLDDSFEHEVWNESDRRRVVLVLDLWHPDLSDDEVELLAGLHRYGMVNESSTREYWARNDQARRQYPAPRAEPRSGLEALDAETRDALRAGDLRRAGDQAARYAELERGTRFYPVLRDRDPELPATWAPVLTPSKLSHDVEQLRYLKDRGRAAFDVGPIVDRYEDMLDTLRPLGPSARVPLVGVARDLLGPFYGRLLHVRPTPRVARALSPGWDPAQVEQAYVQNRPNVVTIDDFLTPAAIEGLRLFCLESTVWSQNRYDHGRLGAFFRDGFTCPLLIQIAEELRAYLPRIIGTRHRMTQLWAYKYSPAQPALAPHADFAAVNVNFWITPDIANLDPRSGGLVVYDVAAPMNWDFVSYNRDGARIGKFLSARGARAITIPYRFNRAVVFDSDLFHTTPELHFRGEYESRRINVTLLFGERNDA